jgi:hypothetical protein
MVRRVLLWQVTLCAIALWVGLAAAAGAQGEIPRVTYLNPVAGVSIDLPEDWEMGTNDWGSLFMGLDADVAPGNCRFAPQLWFFYCKETPKAMAEVLKQHVPLLGGQIDSAGPTGNGKEWEVRFTSNGAVGTLHERWLCRTERGLNYVIAAMVKPELEAQVQGGVDAALASCRIIGGPKMKRFMEPSEHAYRMLMPQDWRCESKVVRDPQVPGYFEWRATSPDSACGAFSGKPTVFNIATPYMSATQATQQFILPALAKQVPGLRLDGIKELSRQSAYYRALIKGAGLGDKPLMDKVRADFVAERGGALIRMRVTVATLQMDQSAILGGRGDWMLFASGAWAPDNQFEKLYPLGRGVMASLATDPDWKDKQLGTVSDVALDRAWLRDAAMWCWDVILTRLN